MTHLYLEDAEVGTACKAGPYLVSSHERTLTERQNVSQDQIRSWRLLGVKLTCSGLVITS